MNPSHRMDTPRPCAVDLYLQDMEAPMIDTDVCGVGAGIVGIAHALEARERGLRVVVLDRAERALGASVRNFGHGCVAAMADGTAFEYALDSRRRWLEL